MIQKLLIMKSSNSEKVLLRKEKEKILFQKSQSIQIEHQNQIIKLKADIEILIHL